MHTPRLLLLLLGTLLAGSIGRSSTTIAAEPGLSSVVDKLQRGEETRIVCFGDSITGAYYHTGGTRAWCDMVGLALQQALPAAKPRMINAGVSGHTTVNGLARIERDVIAHQPDLVVVMFGMNDVTRVPMADYRQNLVEITLRCRAAGAAVVLCTPNSVIENSARPNVKLIECADVVRDVARELELQVVDWLAASAAAREADPEAWRLTMSDAIHPNMHGHRDLAELVAGVVLGRPASLDRVGPLPAQLQRTLRQLDAAQPVKIVAMPPFDVLLPAALRKHWPNADLQVTAWPVEGKSLEQISQWGEQVRALKPDLVVVALPAKARAANREAYINAYEWSLNWSFPFAGRAWDVVPVLPLETDLTDDDRTWLKLAEQIVAGKDIDAIVRAPGDDSSIADIVERWVAARRAMEAQRAGE